MSTVSDFGFCLIVLISMVAGFILGRIRRMTMRLKLVGGPLDGKTLTTDIKRDQLFGEAGRRILPGAPRTIRRCRCGLQSTWSFIYPHKVVAKIVT